MFSLLLLSDGRMDKDTLYSGRTRIGRYAPRALGFETRHGLKTEVMGVVPIHYLITVRK